MLRRADGDEQLWRRVDLNIHINHLGHLLLALSHFLCLQPAHRLPVQRDGRTRTRTRRPRTRPRLVSQLLNLVRRALRDVRLASASAGDVMEEWMG